MWQTGIAASVSDASFGETRRRLLLLALSAESAGGSTDSPSYQNMHITAAPASDVSYTSTTTVLFSVDVPRCGFCIKFYA